jgi:hypothetical protein
MIMMMMGRRWAGSEGIVDVVFRCVEVKWLV